MDVGRHCVTCGRLDFLPFDCRRCGKVLCGDHRLHECVDLPGKISMENKPKQTSIQSSVHSGKQINERVNQRPISRSNQQHKVSPTSASSSKSKPSAASMTQSKPQRLGTSSKPVKNERAVAALDRFKQLMGIGTPPKPAAGSGDLRRSATGDYSIPATERVYFYIERKSHEVKDPLTGSVSTRPPKTVAMFFNKRASAGQILDKASKQLSVPNGVLLIGEETVDLAKSAEELPQKLIVGR